MLETLVAALGSELDQHYMMLVNVLRGNTQESKAGK